MEVLPVAIPLQRLVERLAGTAFGELLADPKPASGGMGLTVALGQPADPAGTRIVFPMPSQRVMHLIDQPQSEIHVPLLPGQTRQAEEIAYRKGVRPQVAPRRAFGDEPGTLREAQHERDGVLSARIRHVPRLLLRALHR